MREGMKDYSPFRPGMSATVDIQTNTKYDVLTVPIQAVTTRADTINARNDTIRTAASPGGEMKEYVFLFEEGFAKMTQVKTGIQDNMYIEILEGLEEGSMVITGPYRAVSSTLKDSDPVKKVERSELYSTRK
jgi:HlyD family secretion protein